MNCNINDFPSNINYDGKVVSEMGPWTWLFGACWTALHVVGVSLFCEARERCQRTGFGYIHGSYGGHGLHAWLRSGRHLDLYIVFWTALHVVGVSLFCEAGDFRYTAVVVAVGCMPGCGLGGI